MFLTCAASPRPVVLPGGRAAAPPAAAVAAHGVAGHAHVLVLVLLRLLALLAQPVVVLDEVDQVRHLVTDVDPLVLACKIVRFLYVSFLPACNASQIHRVASTRAPTLRAFCFEN